MYAAAGGASLASRQARQRQRQQKKTQQLQAKLHPPKASALSVAEHGASTPTRGQSRQFHQLPQNYLRTPQAQSRKLSASYTGQSRLQLLPIDEGDATSVLHMPRMHSHTHHMQQGHSHSVRPVPHSHVVAAAAAAHTPAYHPPPHHQFNYTGGRVSPKLVHRHSGSSGTSFHHSHLPKSATATLPLVSQVEATPPTTPMGAAAAVTTDHRHRSAMSPPATTAATAAIDAMSLPYHDSIFVTPATPIASPGHASKAQHAKATTTDDDLLPDAAAEKQPLTAGAADEEGDEDDDGEAVPPAGALERKCSVYRMRRSDGFEDADGMRRQLKELQFNHQQQYEPLISDEPPLLFKGLPNGRKWQPCAYCEEGICVCEHIECAQGRAAWLERGRRCSVQESQQQAAACHRRWVKRNRIQDASLGGSSDDEDFLGVLRGPSTFANAFLYVGLGTVALGLVIAFVGTGEKGFKTVELRLIGPSLIGLGLICCILRILFCICPSHCISSSKKARKKNGNKVDADHTTSLLRGESKRVSIARGPTMQPKYPLTHKRSNSKMLNEGMEALRQIATTSLFMQNEQKPSSMNRVVPIIKEPGHGVEAPLEMKKLETSLNVCEMSDEDDEDENKIRGASTTIVNNNYGNNAPTTTAAKTKAKRTSTTTTAQAATAATVTAIANTTTTTIVNEKSPSLNAAFVTEASASAAAAATSTKLARQRVALNQVQTQQPQQQHQPLQQSNSLSSSSTIKDASIDGGDELLMETSLMVVSQSAPASEAPPPLLLGSTPTPTATAAATTTTATSTTTIQPPAYASGAIPRHTATANSIAVSSAYDLPSATPHTYAAAAAAAASSRLGGERGETLIRGPLGMPLSALTASSSTYAIPATPPQPPAPASKSKSMPFTPAVVTTTTVSLLPLPAPPLATTATAPAPAPAPPPLFLPGQVMDAAMSVPSFSSYTASARPNSGGNTSITTAGATTSRSILLPHSAGLSRNAAPISFKFPTPLSSASTSSACSLASSNGRRPASASLAPTPPHASKFEPELLLSPAKLGQ